MEHNSKRDLIARAVILIDNKVLVNQSRSKKTGAEYCALPGGHVDPGESCVEALRRELLEELGCESRIGELGFVTESIYAGRTAGEEKRHELVLCFRAELLQMPPRDGDKIRSPEPEKHFMWLPVRDLDAANLLPRDARKQVLRMATGASATPAYSFDDTTR